MKILFYFIFIICNIILLSLGYYNFKTFHKYFYIYLNYNINDCNIHLFNISYY